MSASGWPGNSPTWANARKVGVGTANTLESKVWFSLASGVLTEVYYPTLDRPNTRDLRLLVTDGKTFCDDETTDMSHKVQLVDTFALAYKLINTDHEGKYRIEKTILTHPSRNAVIMRVKFDALSGNVSDYTIYSYFDPHVNNSGWTDSGKRVMDRDGREAFVASDGPVSLALACDNGFIKGSVGFVGTSDKLSELKHKFSLDDSRLQPEAIDGNIAHLGQIRTDSSGAFTLALGFGRDTESAFEEARGALAGDFESILDQYVSGWRSYCSSLDDLGGRATQLYYVSAMVLKALEDKTYRGGMIASLSIPWGEASDDNNRGGYHMVWARDLYHVARAFMALGDTDAANRALDYLNSIQQRPDGSFPQNSWLDGTAYWQSVQLDEVADPIILAWELGRFDLYESMVRPAADYICKHGPRSEQERWEENGGYSPSTLAAEIAGLVCAADMAEKLGDRVRAEEYLSKADEWESKLEQWCFTSTGWYGTGRHYLRITNSGNPDVGETICLSNHAGIYDEREIVDAGFLELVRLGIRRPDDPCIIESLEAVDDILRVETPKGPGFRRYTHDGYGEMEDGSPYRGMGKGRLWVHLTGERAHYELALGRPVDSYLRTIEAFANEGYMLPEQVFEDTGEGTGSATPLAWAHAEYIRLLISAHRGRVIDTPSVVYERYAARQADAAGRRFDRRRVVGDEMSA